MHLGRVGNRDDRRSVRLSIAPFNEALFIRLKGAAVLHASAMVISEVPKKQAKAHRLAGRFECSFWTAITAALQVT
jgi:hypothetical protein